MSRVARDLENARRHLERAEAILDNLPAPADDIKLFRDLRIEMDRLNMAREAVIDCRSVLWTRLTEQLNLGAPQQAITVAEIGSALLLRLGLGR